MARCVEEMFMTLFYSLYLSPNRPSVAMAYKIACGIAERSNVFPLTIAQTRVRLAKLDKNAVILAREGEKAFKAAQAREVTR